MIRLFALVNVLLRQRWLVLVLPLLAAVLSAVRILHQPRSYTTRATFMSQSATRQPNTSLLAAQFGINLGPIGDVTQGPDFYSDLLVSRPILERAVRHTYSVPTDSGVVQQSLVDLHGSETRALAVLRSSLDRNITVKTGVVTLTVRSHAPDLSRQIGQVLLDQLDEFNKQRRKSRIRAEREFTEQQLSEAARQLRAAEDVLQAFYTENRDFTRSPALRFREERLTREVARRQQVHTSLAQSYEQAKVDEVRDTPVITVIEEPALPRMPDSRHLVSRVLLSLVLGLVAAVILAFIIDALRTLRAEPGNELTEFRTLGRKFLAEIRNPFGTARRLFS